EQNRDPSTFPIAKRVYIAVDDSTARARERITAALEEQYGYFGIKGLSPVAVAGPPEACGHGLAEAFHTGADMILLNPLFADLQQMERLLGEVVVGLRVADYDGRSHQRRRSAGTQVGLPVRQIRNRLGNRR